jgi:DNA primase
LRHIKVLSPRSQEGFAGPADCLLNLGYVSDRLALFNRRCLLVEGPVDCAHAWPDAVASWGKKISPQQIELLIRAGVQGLDLCWDSDASAEMMRVSPILADLFDLRIVTLPPGRDPGDLSKEQIEACRADAVHLGSGDRLARLP